MKRFLPSLLAGAVLLAGPAVTFAATEKEAATTDATEDEIMQLLEEQSANPDVMMEGRGGGGMGIMYPGPYGGGIMVDASITKEVTPDFVAINAYCDLRGQTREQARTEANQIYTTIKSTVGTDGRVRKQGSVSIYPIYGPMGEETGGYSANLSLFIRIMKTDRAMAISDTVEAQGCSVNWDVRLVDVQEFEMSVLDSLSTRLNKRKAVFEKLLGRKLNTVSSASLSTWVDGYISYDPETNKADATTTLSVTFNPGTRTTLPSSSSTRRTMTPRG